MDAALLKRPNAPPNSGRPQPAKVEAEGVSPPVTDTPKRLAKSSMRPPNRESALGKAEDNWEACFASSGRRRYPPKLRRAKTTTVTRPAAIGLGTLRRCKISTGPERATAKSNPVESRSTVVTMPAKKRHTRNRLKTNNPTRRNSRVVWESSTFISLPVGYCAGQGTRELGKATRRPLLLHRSGCLWGTGKPPQRRRTEALLGYPGLSWPITLSATVGRRWCP